VEHLASLLCYDRGRTWLLAIEADLAEHGSRKQSAKPNTLPVLSVEENGGPTGSDQIDAGRGVTLLHQNVARLERSVDQVRLEASREVARQLAGIAVIGHLTE
jgi:hypothetical protein